MKKISVSLKEAQEIFLETIKDAQGPFITFSSPSEGW
jgi:hypothetical protein